MPTPVFSVVIPTYNSANFITGTLDSLGGQIFKDFEIVIINDGSKDNTQSVISKYIDCHPNLNIHLFNQDNGGIANARNRGISEARGSYIAFLDHDDIWYPNKLDKCFEVFSKHEDIHLVCHDELLRNNQNRTVRHLHHGPYTSDMFRRLLFKGNYLSTSATLVRKNTLLHGGLFREYPEFSTVEDYDLWIRLSKKYRFYFIREVLGEYIIHNENASSNAENNYNNLVNMLRLNFKEYDKKGPIDYLLINARIFKIYLIVVRHLLARGDVNKALGYLCKSFLSLFQYA